MRALKGLMVAKTILVTGSTDGIGKATAQELLLRGHRVIIHGRDREKGHRVLEELTRTTGHNASDLFIADLSSQKAIRRLADELITAHSRLDVLINNAGTYQPERRITGEGVEMTFAVNYLAPFLLSHYLIDLLQESAPSRVVNVASSAHRDVSRIDWENLQGERGYDPWYAYALSKVAVVTFTYRLARLLKGRGVMVYCLHPGVINTNLLQTAFPGMQGASPEKGATTSVFLATSPAVGEKTGLYYEEMQQVRSEPLTYDTDVQDRLWMVAERATGLTVSP
jgi:NAD(P)-dependent dehydrogenase (short-subunit alcohol dehydrogenase family)